MNVNDTIGASISRALGKARPVARRILLIAGEESGDVYAGRLIRSLAEKIEGVAVEGIGGTRFREAGGKTFYDIKDVSSVGLGAAFKTVGTLRAALAAFSEKLAEGEYDAVILIDFPDFNLRLAKVADKNGIPVFYYVCPQLWAWRQYRVTTAHDVVDMMIVAFPFEVDYYAGRGIDARFFGHPLLDELPEPTPRRRFREECGVTDPRTTLLGLLPGSREGEIRRMLPLLLDAIKLIRVKKVVKVVLPLAASVSEDLVRAIVREKNEEVKIVRGGAWDTMNACDFLICKSGTSTLQAALARAPMVVVYKGDPLSYWIAKFLVKVKWVALPNLLADKEIAPELLQGDCNPAAIARTTLSYLLDPEKRKRQVAELEKIGASLGEKGASGRAVEAIISFLTRVR